MAISPAKRRWLLIGMGVVLVGGVGIVIAARVAAKRFEPAIRAQAIEYLESRFRCRVELAALRVNMPRLSLVDLLVRGGKGHVVRVEGEGLSMKFAPDFPPLFALKSFRFDLGLEMLTRSEKTVESVVIEGMKINIPPKGQRPSVGGSGNPVKVLVRDVQIAGADLFILPKDPSRKPLHFDISRLHLKSAGTDSAMDYQASLTNPKPPGQIESSGKFGPWAADEPGDTPLAGKYTFSNADLGVFKGIAGILQSTGNFTGVLNSITARGEASVPDFRLTSAGNPVPLHTDFEVLVDGTNGDTVLQPVRATLGSTKFTTTGAVIKHEKENRRRLNFDVTMPNGQMRDLLRLAAKGSPFLEGRIRMSCRIEIPPMSGKVKEKLRLSGRFDLKNAKFLRANIQDKIDELSRRGQGHPGDQAIDDVLSNMKGKFNLQDQVMRLDSLSFNLPGAAVAVAGQYDMANDQLDFHGSLSLTAKVSETMTGWKRWLLKPADPFFAKNGAGTFLRIRIQGSAHDPKFGPDHGGGEVGEARK